MTKKDDINFDYNEEVKKCKTIDDVIGKDGLVQRLIKDVLENILEVEMGEHLGRDKYDRQTDIDQDWSYVNILDTKSQTFLCCTSS